MATVGQTSLELQGVDAFKRKLDKLGTRMPEVLGRALEEVAHMAKAHMQERYLTNGPLYVGGRTKRSSQGAKAGQLRNNWQVRKLLGTTTATVGAEVSTNTKYARVHNYGFHGPVHVREHLRKRSSSTYPTQRVPRSKQGRARFRAEVRSKAADTRRREQSSRAAHGVNVRAKQAQSRVARRARGLQGPIEASSGLLDKKARATGAIVVRAHGRYMKIRGHLYVERTLRDVQKRAEALLVKRLTDAVERG